MSATPQEMELLARQINQAHRHAISTGLARAGLSEVGHPMLISILDSSRQESGETGCHTQRDLAELLHISPAAVANSLKSLERGGYIRREPSLGDARCNRVLLTLKGEQAVQGCHRIFEQVSARMMDGFSEEELEQLLSFRRRMLHNLRDGCPEEKEEV